MTVIIFLLTKASLGSSVPSAGWTDRSFCSDFWIFHLKSIGSRVQFLMVKVREEQVPTQVGLKYRLPSPSKSSARGSALL